MSISIKNPLFGLYLGKTKYLTLWYLRSLARGDKTEKVNLKGFEERKDPLIGDYPL